jgi:hypothetical protein
MSCPYNCYTINTHPHILNSRVAYAAVSFRLPIQPRYDLTFATLSHTKG